MLGVRGLSHCLSLDTHREFLFLSGSVSSVLTQPSPGEGAIVNDSIQTSPDLRGYVSQGLI